MPKLIDMLGFEVGRIRVLSSTKDERGRVVWIAKCSCGNSLKAYGPALRDGRHLSCGCWRSESVRMRNTTHGATRTSEYSIWMAMKLRCISNERYAGRGITVCDRWAVSFDNFLSDMGKRPTSTHSIDRIDNDKGYSPENCRWATPAVQNSNTRKNILVEHGGKQITVAEWCRITGVHPQTAYGRIRKGYPIDAKLKSGPRPKAP